MKTVRDLLRDADPLRHEPRPSGAERDRIRQAVVVAASEVTRASAAWFRAPIALLAVVAVIVIGILAMYSRIGPQGSATVYAAVRFEVRLAEDRAAAGLREARVPGSDRVIYLHEEIVVTNADIERSTLVQGDRPSRFGVNVEFTEAGARKMREATANHLGRPAAILIDGDVVMAPTVRAPIGASAVISGDFSRADAERIVNGIGVR
jgi:hypothetical protein